MANIAQSVNHKTVSNADLSGTRVNGANRRDALIKGARQQAGQASDPYARELIAAAARYAALGWVSIPIDLRSGKTPACQWKGLTSESAVGNVARQQRAIQRLGAADTGIAVLTAQSGLVVLDCDSKPIEGCPHNQTVDDDGQPARASARLDALLTMARASFDGQGLWASTQSGGWHLVFTRPEGATIQSSASRHVRGVDVRAGWPREDGTCQSSGYFIAAPTRTPKGEYVWGADLDAITELPEALSALLHTKPGKNGTLETFDPTVQDAGSGRFVGELTDDARGQRWAYAAKAMQAELQRLRDAAPSTRNATLNAVAFRLGQLDEAGMLDDGVRETIANQIVQIALEIGQSEQEAFATTMSGWNAGHDKPDPKLAAIGLPKVGAVTHALPAHVLNGAGAASAANPENADDLQSLIDTVQVAINATFADDANASEFFDGGEAFEALVKLYPGDAYKRLRALIKKLPGVSITEVERDVRRERTRRRAAQEKRAKLPVGSQAEIEINWPDTSLVGKPMPSIINVRAALAHIGVSVHRDEFSGETIVVNGEGTAIIFTDDACIQLMTRVEELGLRIGRAALWDYIRSEGLNNPYHPVKEFLEGLEWDGVKRLDRWLVAYCGASDTPYTRCVGQLQLLAAVRRIYQPGAKFDQMLVLEGAQGNGKSTVWSILGGSWFSDQMTLGLSGKEMIELTAGSWIVEVAELGGMSRADIDKVKAQLARSEDAGCLKYDRGKTKKPRGYVLVGSVNPNDADGAYLKDPTGGRRFWPVAVGECDLSALARDADQLWAEALALHRSGASIKMPRQLWAAAGQEQEARREIDPIEERVQELVSGISDGFVASHTIRVLLQAPDNSTTINRAVTRGMVRAGWVRNKRCYLTTGKAARWVTENGYSIGNGQQVFTAGVNQLVPT